MSDYRNELDFLVAAIKEMRRIRREHGFKAADEFQRKMEKYFRLPPDFRSSFIYDTLLRLARSPAEATRERDPKNLERIHALYKGEQFTLFGKPCIFLWHTTPRDELSEGFFEYAYEDNPQLYRVMDYNDAWSLLEDGDLVV